MSLKILTIKKYKRSNFFNIKPESAVDLFQKKYLRYARIEITRYKSWGILGDFVQV